MKSLFPWKNKRSDSAPAVWNNNWCSHFFEDPYKSRMFPARFFAGNNSPNIDISHDKDAVVVRAEVPGMNEKDISLTWQNGVLCIKGEKKSEKEYNKHGKDYGECSYGSFSRNITVGKNIDWQKATAQYKNGVLMIRLPKNEQSQKTVSIPVH